MTLATMLKDWREKKTGRSKVNRKLTVVQHRRNGGPAYGNNSRNGEKGMCFAFALAAPSRKTLFRLYGMKHALVSCPQMGT